MESLQSILCHLPMTLRILGTQSFENLERVSKGSEPLRNFSANSSSTERPLLQLRSDEAGKQKQPKSPEITRQALNELLRQQVRFWQQSVIPGGHWTKFSEYFSCRQFTPIPGHKICQYTQEEVRYLEPWALKLLPHPGINSRQWLRRNSPEGHTQTLSMIPSVNHKEQQKLIKDLSIKTHSEVTWSDYREREQ